MLFVASPKLWMMRSSEPEVAFLMYFFLRPVILKHVEQKKICSSYSNEFEIQKFKLKL